MKIAVLNSSGNVGKSVISRELLYPRLDNAEIVEVETVNSGSKELPQLRVTQFKAGDDFVDIYTKIITVDNIIVDIGASNLSNFWDQMREFAGIESLFDIFIVPTVPEPKEMTDTYKSIAFLKENGIDPDKIKVIFNKTKNGVERDFSLLINAMDGGLDYRLSIPKSALFQDLGAIRKTISDVYNPDVESYKEKILSATDGAEKLMLVKMDLVNRQAVAMKENLDRIFAIITGQELVINSRAEELKEIKKESKEEVKTEEENSEISADDEEL